MEEETGNVAGTEVAPTCASCDIGIGPDFIEEKGYPVGDYRLCRLCMHRLLKNGRILLQPYFPTTGVFLFKDGHTEQLPLKDKK